jgi:hypothetical protein
MKQITIVSEDKPGVGAAIVEALASANVNIETMTAEAIRGTAVTILTVDRYDDALRALSQTPYMAVSEDALVVRVEDRPGELAKLLGRFRDAGINLRSMRIMNRTQQSAVVALCTDQLEEARTLLRDLLVS